ncbi:hypothetical protein ACGH2B_10380 [Streptomyces sp. BBFR2]|uniref:hypothetical protein n=1 Tax=Streptomyces sp. BBFR2 TaxID=3372854 RepID=UPI0037DA0E8D
MTENETLAAHHFKLQLDGVMLEAVKGINHLSIDKNGGKVTIVRGVKTSTAFTEWVNRSLHDGIGAENLTINEEDSAGRTVRRIQLMDARVTKWESGKPNERVFVVAERGSIE